MTFWPQMSYYRGRFFLYTKTNWPISMQNVFCTPRVTLDHIFIRLGSAPPTPLSLPGRPVRTCVETLTRWEAI